MSNAIVGIVRGGRRAHVLISHLEEAGVRIDDDLVLLAGEDSAGDGAKGLLAELVHFAASGIGTLLNHPARNDSAPETPRTRNRRVFESLIQLGISEEAAKHYDDKAHDGELVVAVHVDDPEAGRTVEEALRQSGAHDVSSVPEAPVNDVVFEVA